MTDLDRLAIKHGTDKSSQSHGYTDLYDRYLGNLRAFRSGSLLELGWGGHEDPDAGGASARMWADWLGPGWFITVVDNEHKDLSVDDQQRIHLIEIGQSDKRLAKQLEKSGRAPLDVIIDDASHLSSLTIASFEMLWPLLKPGGWYVVEDTHMAYHDFWYGEEEANPDPDGATKYGFPTAMQFLRRLADEANFKVEGDLFPERYWLGYAVEEIHFHHNICFVKKRY